MELKPSRQLESEIITSYLYLPSAAELVLAAHVSDSGREVFENFLKND